MIRRLIARWQAWRQQPDPPTLAQDKAALVESMAQAVARRGLQTPALLFLECHRPLGFLASQCTLLASPFVLMVAPQARTEALVALLDDPAAVEQLITRIEALSQPQPAAKEV